MRKVFVYGMLALSMVAGRAHADEERPRIDYLGRTWSAVHYSDDGGATTDICLAGALSLELALRSDRDRLEIRSADRTWTLDVGQKGKLTIKIGDYSADFEMEAISPTSLSADVSAEELTKLLNAADTAANATLIYGNNKSSKKISLNGSTKAFNLFRACTKAAGFGDLGASVGPKNSPF